MARTMYLAGSVVVALVVVGALACEAWWNPRADAGDKQRSNIILQDKGYLVPALQGKCVLQGYAELCKAIQKLPVWLKGRTTCLGAAIDTPSASAWVTFCVERFDAWPQ